MQDSLKPSQDIPWTSYVEALLEWRRFVIGGVALTWAVILVLRLLVPRTYEGEATLVLPPLAPPKAEGEAFKPGIPLSLYKRFNRALADERMLSQGLKDVMGPREIHSLFLELDQHVTPVSTIPLGDAQRMTREDTVIGIRIKASGRPAEKAARVVTALADLCRETLIRTLFSSAI